MSVEKISLSKLCISKINHLEAQGFQIIGVILAHPAPLDECQRVTIDNFGRTQWWDIDDIGKMVIPTRSK